MQNSAVPGENRNGAWQTVARWEYVCLEPAYDICVDENKGNPSKRIRLRKKRHLWNGCRFWLQMGRKMVVTIDKSCYTIV